MLMGLFRKYRKPRFYFDSFEPCEPSVGGGFYAMRLKDWRL